ncbi:MAG TPA: 50S ribosomal protein L29 [Thermoanaerobacterales bacterium]|nr:50S ribosomal protein L29 [Thermoanaerobacterales bacterium]
MKVKQIRELTNDELTLKIKELKNELFNLRFQAATGQLDNPMRIRQVRKTIARVKTVLTEKEMESQKASGKK